MAKPRFIYNLRPDTFNAAVTQAFTPAGYLLAPAYATRTTRALAQELRKLKYRFVVDNGNFSIIGKVRARYVSTAHKLWLRVTMLEQRLGRSIRLGDESKSIRSAYRKLAANAQAMSQRLTGDGERGLKAQLALNPTALIGLEDITMASWLSLNIEPTYLALNRSSYRAMNRRVARLAVARQSQLPAPLARAYYPVASAMSYNTALDAGREFAKHGVQRVSLGFGAFMADDNWTDYIEIGKKLIAFDGRWPNKYLRTVAVAKGFWDGYKEVSGRAPKAFHFLGLGAPIMIPLVTLAGWETPDLTFDATSPIKDALQGGTLYVSKPAFLKIRTRNIAFRMSIDPTADWDCPCPFCRAFLKTHPFRRERAFRWLKATKAREVAATDLRPSGALFRAFPLFSEPRAGKLRNAINQARIGHNHWVIHQITSGLRRAKSKRQLQDKVSDIITRYEKNSKDDRFGAAIRFSYQLLGGT